MFGKAWHSLAPACLSYYLIVQYLAFVEKANLNWGQAGNMFHNIFPNKIIWFNNTTIWPDIVWKLIVFVFIL